MIWSKDKLLNWVNKDIPSNTNEKRINQQNQTKIQLKTWMKGVLVLTKGNRERFEVCEVG